MKKIVGILLCLTMILTNFNFAKADNVNSKTPCNNMSNETIVKGKIESYFQMYYQSLVDNKYDERIHELFIDNSGTFIAQNYLNIDLIKQIDDKMTYFTIEDEYGKINIKNDKAKVNMYCSARYRYTKYSDLLGSGRNFEFELTKVNNEWEISNVKSDDHIYRYSDKISSLDEKSKIEGLKNYLNELEKSAHEIVELVREQSKRDVPVVNNEQEQRVVPAPVPNYSYNQDKGAAYANQYFDRKATSNSIKLFYVDPNADCTNFVSQCVWAAYGGWIEGYDAKTIASNAANIKNDVRQVTGVWYGSKSNVGSNKWCRVGEFHDYVVSNKTYGPTGTSYGNVAITKFQPSSVKKGDVIQFMESGYNPGNYGHSLYVIDVKKNAKTLADIMVVCHSDDDRATLKDKMDGVVKIRGIRFATAKFAK